MIRAVLAWLILAILGFLAWWYLPPIEVDRPVILTPTKKEAVRLMKYHGIDGFTCDLSGCWFERNGKEVRL